MELMNEIEDSGQLSCMRRWNHVADHCAVPTLATTHTYIAVIINLIRRRYYPGTGIYD